MPNFDELRAQIRTRDTDNLADFNKVRRARNQPQYVLNEELGPCPFEGDINNAPVVLLLANPSSTDVLAGDHHAPDRDWPLHGLGPMASAPLRRWWSLRLRELGEAAKCDMQGIARSIAAVQLNPWASVSYHAGFKSGSRQLQFEIAQAAMARGAILVLMRAKREWSACPDVQNYEHLIETINPRCSYLSPGNILSKDWKKIVSSVQKHVAKTHG